MTVTPKLSIELTGNAAIRDPLKLWWFDSRSANRGEYVALFAGALYVLSAFLPQATLCTEEMTHDFGCQGEVHTVWFESSVLVTSFLAAGVVLAAVYISQHPTKFSDSWNPSTPLIVLVASIVSFVIASMGAPRGDVLELLLGTWVQTAAFAVMVLYVLSAATLEVLPRIIDRKA